MLSTAYLMALVPAQQIFSTIKTVLAMVNLLKITFGYWCGCFAYQCFCVALLAWALERSEESVRFPKQGLEIVVSH